MKHLKKYMIIGIIFVLITGTLLIPLCYYAYTHILGKNVFILDISTFILSIITAFWISYKLTLSCRLESYTSFLCILVFTLFVCFLVFTYHPLGAAIFQVQIPYISASNRNL